MKAPIFLSIVMLMLIGIGSVQAQPLRNKAQKERIANGERNGQLNRHEAYRLAHEQRHIRHDRMRFKRNDGHIGPRERKHLMHERRKASRHIYHYKHNDRVRQYK